MAVVGMLGGLLFAAGDLLVYLVPGYHGGASIYADWQGMSMLRFAACMYLGCIGGVLLLVGFYSLHCIAADVCKASGKAVMLIIASGIILTPIGHFIIACITPMTYKAAISAGLGSETALAMSGFWSPYIGPVKVYVMVVVILLQSVFMVYLIGSKKINCPKWMAILNPVGFILVSIPVSILLSGTGMEGIAEAFESLGEGAMYLAVYTHWKRSQNLDVQPLLN